MDLWAPYTEITNGFLVTFFFFFGPRIACLQVVGASICFDFHEDASFVQSFVEVWGGVLG